VGPGCEKNGRSATWAVTTRSGRHQVPVAVLPTAKSLSAFSLKPQSDRLLGIRVNGVAPGPVETAMAKAVHTPEIRADYHDAIPLNRYGLEEELAEAVFFLCSDRASYITGQILAVDGGFDAAGIGLPTLRGERRNS